MSARIVIGIHSVREVLKVRPNKVTVLKVKPEWKSSKEIRPIVELAQQLNVKVQSVSESVLEKLGRGHQGVCLEVVESPVFSPNTLNKKSLLLALDQISDPQNLGAILRTSWLMGVSGIFVTKDRSSPMTPTVFKIASGGAEHVPVTEVNNLGSWIKDKKEKGFWVFGLHATGDKKIWNSSMHEKLILVLGAEGHGIRKPVLNLCDELISLPQTDSGASYNVSAAAAMAMYEVQRQWNLK